MKLTPINLTHAFKITDVPALAPIWVYLQDYGDGRGRLTIECYGSAWAAYWGAMGSRNLIQFISEANSSYLQNCLGRDQERPGYLERIITAVKEAVRKLGEAGEPAANETIPYEGPDFSDGCDHEGFAGGCARAGHTPLTCPTFQIGDTVRFKEPHMAAGDIGVLVGQEVWLDENRTQVWDGVGDIPAYKPLSSNLLHPPVTRWLLRLLAYGDPSEEVTPNVRGWRRRALQSPHNYPFVVGRELALVSRPEFKVLDGSGGLGSVIARDTSLGVFTCISDSVVGARRDVALAKAAKCLPLTKEGA